jgi:hypothetical protein
MTIVNGHKLSDAALYSYQVQDVYPDIMSFVSAIPDHLKPIFLQPVAAHYAGFSIAATIAHKISSESMPTGNTPDGDLFSTKTFVNHDNENTVPTSDEGSIFEINGPGERTHHQENNPDENITAPSNTSYMTDVDMSDYFSYPYRSNTKVRKSSVNKPVKRVAVMHLAMTADALVDKIKRDNKVRVNAANISVEKLDYSASDRLFTLKASGGEDDHQVDLALMDSENVAVSCDCNFWRFNGPEYLAKTNEYLYGKEYGSATKAEIRDPEGKYWLCKHTYAALLVVDDFMKGVKEKLPEDASEEDIMEEVNQNQEVLDTPTDVSLQDGKVEEFADEFDDDQDVDQEPSEADLEEIQTKADQVQSAPPDPKDFAPIPEEDEDGYPLDQDEVEQAQEEDEEEEVDTKSQFDKKMEKYEKMEEEEYKALRDSKKPKKPLTDQEREEAGIGQFTTDVEEGQSDQGQQVTPGRYDQQSQRQSSTKSITRGHDRFSYDVVHSKV